MKAKRPARAKSRDIDKATLRRLALKLKELEDKDEEKARALSERFQKTGDSRFLKQVRDSLDKREKAQRKACANILKLTTAQRLEGPPSRLTQDLLAIVPSEGIVRVVREYFAEDRDTAMRRATRFE